MFNLNLNTFMIALVASATFAAAVPMAIPDAAVFPDQPGLNVRVGNTLPDIGSTIGAGHPLPGAGTGGNGNSNNGTDRVANPDAQRGRQSTYKPGQGNNTTNNDFDDWPEDDDDDDDDHHEPSGGGHDADEDYGEPAYNSSPDSEDN